MINLFDNYNQESYDLHNSLKKSGIFNKTIVINYNGFLPEDVESPFSYFLYKEEVSGEPLYFNRLEIPKYWEIESDNNSAVIKDYNKVRANIHYVEPKHKRLVHYVEWLDEQGNIRSVDHYNKYGYRYASSAYNNGIGIVNTSYFNAAGKEVIVENHVTQDIILNEDDNKILIFKNKLEFVEYYLKINNLYKENVVYNTLANPFLLTTRNSNPGHDILVWQEDIGDSLPGNMLFILENDIRTKSIIVPNKEVYKKIISLVTDNKKHMFKPLGYVYEFVREETYNNQIFILTNSDQIEHIEYILNNVTDAWVHIAAITEMSPKLMSLIHKAKNITLHPNASISKINNLFGECTYYLDINHSNELLSAVRTAFDNKMLILGFENTVHNRNYIAKDNIYNSEDVEKLVEKINKSIVDKEYKDESIKNQLSFANFVSEEEYRKCFNV